MIDREQLIIDRIAIATACQLLVQQFERTPIPDTIDPAITRNIVGMVEGLRTLSRDYGRLLMSCNEHVDTLKREKNQVLFRVRQMLAVFNDFLYTHVAPLPKVSEQQELVN